MIIKKTFLFLSLMLLLHISCNTSEKKEAKTEISKETVENIKNIEVDIEGMTCEIGCAKLIQSKLFKTEGVKFAEISFENKMGKISYDANKISTNDIKNRIQKIAGGDLYRVTQSREVDFFSATN